jgi:REP element-mobilizing transposase RayT
MPQSLAQIYLHIVFSTKHRTPWLIDKALQSELHRYLGGICHNLQTPALSVGGVEDHVHFLCRLPRTLTVADLLREVKRSSSLWVKEKDKKLFDFHWQDGYGVFSVSPSHVEALIAYIANQEAHHAKESFQDEYRRLLAKYGIDYDERYVWD